MSLPDFFIIGAPKSGTTALHAALADHPQLFLSSVKEPKYFLCDGPPPRYGGPGDAHSYREWVWRREDYERLFDAAPAGALRGESTPFYLAGPRRPPPDRRGGARCPAHPDPAGPGRPGLLELGAPVGRRSGARQRLPHRLCRRTQARRGRAGPRSGGTWRPASTADRSSTCGPLPTRQLHLIRYKDLVDEPAATLDGVCRFLGVDEGVLAEAPPRNVGGYVHPTLYNRVLQETFRRGAVGREPLPAPGVAQGEPAPPVADPAVAPAPPGAGRGGPGRPDRLLRRRHRRRRGGDRLGPRASGGPTARAARTRCASRGRRRGASSRSRGACPPSGSSTTDA